VSSGQASFLLGFYYQDIFLACHLAVPDLNSVHQSIHSMVWICVQYTWWAEGNDRRVYRLLQQQTHTGEFRRPDSLRCKGSILRI